MENEIIKGRAAALRLLFLALVFSFAITGAAQAAAAKNKYYSTTKTSEKTITVTTRTSAGKKTMKYHRYKENNLSGYLGRQGCVHVATAIAASAFGKKYSPSQIYSGSDKNRFSERYAMKKLKSRGNAYLRGTAAMTVTLSAQILKDMGIPVRVRYDVTGKKAYQEIREHLKKGLPVIVKVKNITYKGLKFTPTHHALVLAGIDQKNHVILIETRTAKVNLARVTGKKVTLTLQEFMKKFMFNGSSSAKQPYVGTYSAAGGYILVGR